MSLYSVCFSTKISFRIEKLRFHEMMQLIWPWLYIQYLYSTIYTTLHVGISRLIHTISSSRSSERWRRSPTVRGRRRPCPPSVTRNLSSRSSWCASRVGDGHGIPSRRHARLRTVKCSDTSSRDRCIAVTGDDRTYSVFCPGIWNDALSTCCLSICLR